MALIFILSSRTDPDPLPDYLSDKLAHMAVYGLLGLLVVRALSDGRLAQVSWGRAAAALGISLLYGLSDEWHQSMVPGRHSELMDVVADAVGAAAGVAGFASLGVLRKVYFDDPPGGESRP
jgi:VanZ family protein